MHHLKSVAEPSLAFNDLAVPDSENVSASLNQKRQIVVFHFVCKMN